jgi:putative ABC transport system permease protein
MPCAVPDQGRFLNPFDDQPGIQAAVLGADAAALFALVPGQPRTILLNDELFGVVGVLAPTELLPELNSAIVITYPAAERVFASSSEPDQLYVRVQNGTTAASAGAISLAITQGAPGIPLVRVPTDLLEAEAKVDATFRAIVLGLGGLSLLIGGIGIANVMTIAVLQRSSEIGIRRALGHTRPIIASQFLLESALIGVLGGALGLLVGLAFVMVAADYQDWRLELQLPPLIGVASFSVAVAIVAGLYPAIRAARMEPLETLRRA